MKTSLPTRFLLATAFVFAAAGHALAQTVEPFAAGDLLVSGSTYSATASTITLGETLPNGAAAAATGAYPGVFNNDTPDPSFGITSPIIINEITPSGSVVQSINITQLAATEDDINLSNSFSSKSELALNLSSDGTAVTFMGYISPINTLDVSNSNTPNHVDSTNTISPGVTVQRAIVQLNFDDTLTVSAVDAYSGNNGRSAILSGGNYYLAGNGGNGTGTAPGQIVDDTGIQMIAQGGSGETTPVGVKWNAVTSTSGFQYGFSVAQPNVGDTADKTGKDDNLRGLALYNNTLYVSKGSGSNGIDTVYQVNPSGGGYVSAGTGAGLPTAGNASSTTLNILPGFPTTLAKTTISAANPAFNPFGLWFANATTLYVADEGDGIAGDLTNGNDPHSGLQKWSLVGGVWKLDYVLQSGLSLGTAYSVAGYTGPAPANDGLRNITGQVNSNGTVTIFGIASTVSNLADEGADPNGMFEITDTLADTTSAQSSAEAFSPVSTEDAQNGQVLRGVSFVPQAIPEPSTYAGFFGALALAGAGWMRRRNHRQA